MAMPIRTHYNLFSVGICCKQNTKTLPSSCCITASRKLGVLECLGYYILLRLSTETIEYYPDIIAIYLSYAN
jgi:hypothetical protein